MPEHAVKRANSESPLSERSLKELRRFAFKPPADPDDYDTDEERKYVEGFERARAIVKFIVQISDGVRHG